MNICIPSQDDRGLDSEVHDHFGSGPWFTIVNTENDQAKPVRNPSCHQSVGSCHHIDMLRAKNVAVVVSSGMGRRAWSSLREAEITVLAAPARGVKDIVAAVKEGDAPPRALESACTGGHGHHHGQGLGQGRGRGLGHGHGHGHGHGCSHDHHHGHQD
jgi:predicted Fe-Mo cluster-binding NifX family protein